MNDFKLLTNFIQGVAIQLPILLVAIIGAIMTISRWKDAPSAGVWALLGFGIAALLCILVPAGQLGVSYWISSGGGHASQIQPIYMVLGVVWSLLRAASYVLLLAAIFAGRPQSA